MSVSSQDSGFTSQDTLYPRPPSSFSEVQVRGRKTNENKINPTNLQNCNLISINNGVILLLIFFD